MCIQLLLLPILGLSGVRMFSAKRESACEMTQACRLAVDQETVNITMQAPPFFQDVDVDAFWRRGLQDFAGMYQTYFFGARYPYPKSLNTANEEIRSMSFNGVPWVYAGVHTGPSKTNRNLELRPGKLWRAKQPLLEIYELATKKPFNLPEDAFLESCKTNSSNPTGEAAYCYASFLQQLWGITNQADYARQMSSLPVLPLPPVPKEYKLTLRDARSTGPVTWDPDLEPENWRKTVTDDSKLLHWREVYLNGPHPWAENRGQDRTQPEAAHSKTEITDIFRDAKKEYAFSLSFLPAVRVAFARMFQLWTRTAHSTDLREKSLNWLQDPGDEVIPSAFTDALYEKLEGYATMFEDPVYQQGRIASIVSKITQGGLPAVVGLCEFFDEAEFTELFGKVFLQPAGVTSYKRGDTIAMYYDSKQLDLNRTFEYVSDADSKSVLFAIFEKGDLKTDGRVLVVVMLHNQQSTAKMTIKSKFEELRGKVTDGLKEVYGPTLPIRRDYIVMGDMNTHLEGSENEELLVQTFDQTPLTKVELPDPSTEPQVPNPYRTDLKSRQEIDYMFTNMQSGVEWGAKSVSESPQECQNKAWESIYNDHSDHVMLKNLVGHSGGKPFPVVSWNVMDPETLDAFDPKQVELGIVKEVKEDMDAKGTWATMKQQHSEFGQFLEEIVDHA